MNAPVMMCGASSQTNMISIAPDPAVAEEDPFVTKIRTSIIEDRKETNKSALSMNQDIQEPMRDTPIGKEEREEILSQIKIL